MTIAKFCFLIIVLLSSFTVKAECSLGPARSYNDNYIDAGANKLARVVFAVLRTGNDYNETKVCG